MALGLASVLVPLNARVLPPSEGLAVLSWLAEAWVPGATTRWRHNPANCLQAQGTPGPWAEEPEVG